MKLIKICVGKDENVWINPEHVVVVSKGNNDLTNIGMVNRNILYCTNPIVDVIRMINEAYVR